MKITLTIDGYNFIICPTKKYIKLTNPSDATDVNYLDMIDGECVEVSFMQIMNNYNPILKKYPFKKVLDKYRKLKAFV